MTQKAGATDNTTHPQVFAGPTQLAISSTRRPAPLLSENKDFIFYQGFYYGMLVIGLAVYIASMMLLFQSNEENEELQQLLNSISVAIYGAMIPIMILWFHTIHVHFFKDEIKPRSKSPIKKLKSWLYSKSLVGRGLIWAHKGTRRFTIRKNGDE